jgi:hypothetical protein
MKLDAVLNNSSLLILVGNSEGVLFLTKITQQDLDFYDWFLVIGFSHKNLAGDLEFISAHNNVMRNYFNRSDGYDLDFNLSDLIAQQSWGYADGCQLVNSLDEAVKIVKQGSISFPSFVEGPNNRATFSLEASRLESSARIPLYFPVGTSIPRELLVRKVDLLTRILMCLSSPSTLSINYWGKNCAQVSNLLGPGLYKLPRVITDYFDITWPSSYTPTLVSYPNKWFSKKPTTGVEYLSFVGSMPTSSFATYISGLVYLVEKTKCFSLFNVNSNSLEEVKRFRGSMVELVSPDRNYVIPSEDLYQMALLVSLGKRGAGNCDTSYSALDLVELEHSRFMSKTLSRDGCKLSLELFTYLFKYPDGLKKSLLHISEQSNKAYRECKHLDNLIKRWSLDLYKRVIRLKLPSAADFPKRSRYNKTVFTILEQAKSLSFETVFTRVNNLVQGLYYRYLAVGSRKEIPSGYFKYLPILYNAILTKEISIDTWNSYSAKLDTITVSATKDQLLEYIAITAADTKLPVFKSAIEGSYGSSSFKVILNKYKEVLDYFKPGDMYIITSDEFKLDLYDVTLQSLERFIQGVLREDATYSQVRIRGLSYLSQLTDSYLDSNSLDPIKVGSNFLHLIYYKEYRLDQLCFTYNSLVENGDVLMLSVVYIPLLKKVLPEVITMLHGSLNSSYFPICLYKTYIVEYLEHLLTEILDLNLGNM